MNQVRIYLKLVQAKDELTFNSKSQSGISSAIAPVIHSKMKQIYVELSLKQQQSSVDVGAFCTQWGIDKARGSEFSLFSFTGGTSPGLI